MLAFSYNKKMPHCNLTTAISGILLGIYFTFSITVIIFLVRENKNSKKNLKELQTIIVNYFKKKEG